MVDGNIDLLKRNGDSVFDLFSVCSSFRIHGVQVLWLLLLQGCVDHFDDSINDEAINYSLDQTVAALLLFLPLMLSVVHHKQLSKINVQIQNVYLSGHLSFCA